jgi:transcriptional repressor NrdR
LQSDVVAYLRFACVYKRFRDVKELVKAIQSVAPKEIEYEESTNATEKK